MCIGVELRDRNPFGNDFINFTVGETFLLRIIDINRLFGVMVMTSWIIQ